MGFGMQNDVAVSMEEPIKRLQNLSEHLPGEESEIYEFAAMLAKRLNPDLLPVGVNLSIELLLHDLKKGVDGYTGRPIHGIGGMPPMFYVVLRLAIPRILDAAFPVEFAKRVKEIMAEVAELSRTSPKPGLPNTAPTDEQPEKTAAPEKSD
jgi:hypothetical protein